jgi:hypothetical protein
MGLNLSALPPELQRRILEQAGLEPVAATRRRPKKREAPSRLLRVCSCLCGIYRPDGNYPERCDGCGRKWQG